LLLRLTGAIYSTNGYEAQGLRWMEKAIAMGLKDEYAQAHVARIAQQAGKLLTTPR